MPLPQTLSLIQSEALRGGSLLVSADTEYETEPTPGFCLVKGIWLFQSSHPQVSQGQIDNKAEDLLSMSDVISAVVNSVVGPVCAVVMVGG